MSFALDQEALSLLSVKLEGNEVIVEWWGVGVLRKRIDPWVCKLEVCQGRQKQAQGCVEGRE